MAVRAFLCPELSVYDTKAQSYGTSLMTSPNTLATDPAWLVTARKYKGLSEIKGPHHNPHILKWARDMGTPIKDDETPWCGLFVGGTLAETGIQPVKGGAMARNWLKLPVALDRMAYGAVCVGWRGDRDSVSGHVGYVVGVDASGNPVLLGGNQGDTVSERAFPKDRVLGYRWPGIYPYETRFDVPLVKATKSTKES
jgi:uncharacterized protein (TIGR02594 family)